jgi:hypothetical protein
LYSIWNISWSVSSSWLAVTSIPTKRNQSIRLPVPVFLTKHETRINQMYVSCLTHYSCV